MAYVAIHQGGESIKFFMGAVTKMITKEALNSWHRKHLFARIFIDGDGDPILEIDLSLKGGIREERIKDFLFTCRCVVENWCINMLHTA
jgi:hypothetical protein